MTTYWIVLETSQSWISTDNTFNCQRTKSARSAIVATRRKLKSTGQIGQPYPIIAL